MKSLNKNLIFAFIMFLSGTMLLGLFNSCDNKGVIEGSSSGESLTVVTGPPPPPPDPAVVPTLSLDFSDQMPNGITFSRNSVATHYGDDGLIKTAAAGQARIDHNPALCENANMNVQQNPTCKRKKIGVFIEEESTNLAAYSNDYLMWNLGASTTITPNAAMAPDGTMTATRAQYPGTTGTFIRYIFPAPPVNSVYTGSVWLKANGKTCASISLENFQVPNANYLQITNQWKRYSVTATFTDVALTTARLTIQNNLGAGMEGECDYFLWGAQLEVKPYPTSYIPTAATAVARAAETLTTNNLDWFNVAEGTFELEFYKYEVVSTQNNTLLHIADLQDNNAYLLKRNPVNDRTSFGAKVNGNISQVAGIGPIWTDVPRHKVVLGHNNTSVIGFENGIPIGLVNIGPLAQAPVQFHLGRGSSAQNPNALNGHIKSLIYTPKRFTDQELIQKSN